MNRAVLQWVERWRRSLSHLPQCNTHLTPTQLNTAIRALLLNLLCLRLCEQSQLITAEQRRSLTSTYPQFCDGLKNIHQHYKTVILADELFALPLEDTLFYELTSELEELWQGTIAPDILGQAYEQCLGGSTLANAGLKRDRRKSNGIYYTPTSVVDYMVNAAIGRWEKAEDRGQEAEGDRGDGGDGGDGRDREGGKTPGFSVLRGQDSVITPETRCLNRTLHPTPYTPHPTPKILDPACGGGIFLLAAYQHLLDWQLHQYRSHLVQKNTTQAGDSRLLQSSNGVWRLTQAERERILLNSIYGVDLDPGAVEVTRLALRFKLLEHGIEHPLHPLPDLSQNICRGNALIGSDFDVSKSKAKFSEVGAFDWEKAFPDVLEAGGFDVVIGNPPYIDSEWMMVCLPSWRSYCTKKYQTAAGNWDIFCVFIEKALQLCREGGFVSLIVPNKLASADYAAKTRSLLIKSNQLLNIRDYSRVSVFSVAVYPLVFVVQKGKPDAHSRIQYEVMDRLEPGTEEGRSLATVSQSYSINYSRYLASPEMPWSFSTPPQQVDLVSRLRKDFPLLGSLAQVTGAATVAEAYRMRSLIHNHPAPEDGDLRVVNSGTIDRYRWRWGEKPLRYLGNVYEHPVIPRSLAEHLPKTRYQQARQAKIIVAGMSKTLECGLDQHGTILAAKSTSVIRSALDLRYLLGILNSRLIQSYFKSSFEGNRLKGGYLRIGPPQLKQIPIRVLNLDDPTERQHHEHMIELIDQLIDQMLTLQEQCNPIVLQSNSSMIQHQINQLDLQIDQLVYRLYGLTDSEIAAISP